MLKKSGHLNLLLLKQAYLVQKLQKGDSNRQAVTDSEKVKLQSRADELDSSEYVRIYQHELQAKHNSET